MSASTYTPGPWAARYVPSGMPTGCVEYGVIGPSGLEIARVWRREDVIAIAAFPKLLAALKALVHDECPIVTHHRPECLFCAALKAIAEAEGRL